MPSFLALGCPNRRIRAGQESVPGQDGDVMLEHRAMEVFRRVNAVVMPELFDSAPRLEGVFEVTPGETVLVDEGAKTRMVRGPSRDSRLA